jgi:hypothetical protein
MIRFQLPRYEVDAKRVAAEKSNAKGLEETEHYAVGPKSQLRIKLAQKGLAADAPLTAIEVFKLAVKNQANSVAMKQERGGDGKWVEWTWQQYYDQTMQCARAFIALGLEPAQSVNILGFNSPEWFISDMAAIAAGGKAAGIYPTNNAAACQYITEHSEAPIVVVENEAQLKKYLAIRDALPKLRAIVLYTGAVPAGVNAPGKARVLSWEEMMALGNGAQDNSKDSKGMSQEALQKALDERVAAQKPGALRCSFLLLCCGRGSLKIVRLQVIARPSSTRVAPPV